MRSLDHEDPLTGLSVKELMRLHGASYQSIISLAGPGAPQQAQVLRRPPVFKTNFLRVPRLAFDDRRLLAKLHCDNPVCPERGGGVGGKAVQARIVVATHILWAPEVPTGALCPHCRTMPGHPDIVFPTAYLQNYRRTSRIEHGTRSRTVLAA